MTNLFDVADKVVLVTGGSRGIGAMIASGFVEHGANVFISSRKAVACNALCEQLSRRGKCASVPADLGTQGGVVHLANEMRNKTSRLDVLVNNAGATWVAPIDVYPEGGWDKIVDLNLKSVFFLTQQLLPLLRAASSRDSPARVINISSTNGINPSVLKVFENYAYSASKAGCIMLTRHLAKRLASEHILVNAIAPGPFETPMMAAALQERGNEIRATTALNRLGMPEDIVGTSIFLASRASSYITGAVIPCDGG